MRRSKGFTLVELLVVIGIIVILATILFPALAKARELARRAVCSGNLNSIGKAMAMYINEYGGKTPWLVSDDWECATGTNAEEEDQPDTLSVTSLLFLLVRSGQNPGLFVCPSDDEASEMTSEKFKGAGDDKYYYWDFFDTKEGAVALDHAKKCSYSMQAPVSKGGGFSPGYTSSSQSMLAVVADKTPVYDEKEPIDWTEQPLPDLERKSGMSQNHQGESINVLYAGSNVSDEKRADCGIDEDNIYSASGDADEGDPAAVSTDLGDHLCEDDTFLMGPIIE